MSTPFGRFRDQGVYGAIVVGALFAAFVVGSGLVFYRESKRALLSQVEARLSAIADLKVEQLVQWREEVQAEGKFQMDAAPDVPIWSVVRSESLSRDETSALQAWLRRVAENLGAEDVSLIDAKGRLRQSSAGVRGRPSFPPALRALALKALSQRRVLMGDIRLSPHMGVPDIDLAVPLLAKSGAGIGAIVYHFPTELFIEPVVQQWPGPSESAECVLVRREGAGLIALNELRFRENAVLSRIGSADDARLPAAVAAQGREAFVRGRDYRGVPVLAVTRSVPGTDWHLVAKLDESEALAPLQSRSRFIVGCLLLLVLAVSFWLLYGAKTRDAEVLADALRIEREQTSLSERYAALTRQANDAVFLIDEWMKVVEANEKAEALFGYGPGELVGSTLSRLDAGGREPLNEKVDSKVGQIYETRYRSKDGALVPVEVSVSRVRMQAKHLYLALVRDITERAKAQEERRLNEARLNALLEFSTIPMGLDEAALFKIGVEKFAALTRSRICYLHQVGEDQKTLSLTAWSAETLKACTALHDEHYPLDKAGIWADSFRFKEVVIHNDYAAAEGKRGMPEGHFPLKRHMGVTVFDEEGKGRLVVGVGDKETPYDADDARLIRIAGDAFWQTLSLRRAELARRAAEGRLHQVQRLETVGRLAGGVAHDFNNILTALLGNCALLKESMPEGDPRLADLVEIENCGLRAAALTRQLLAFSRRQRVAPQPTDMNAVVSGLHPMLRRLIGEDIQIVLNLTAQPWTVMIDPGQAEQVLLNLAVNSRDAMPRGGKLAIATANLTLAAPRVCATGAIPAGRCLRLSVADEGEGMSLQTQEHLFEPFFTTKVQGKGTGLGLATVCGIIQQASGGIEVVSAPGRGAAFMVYLPAVDVPAVKPASAPFSAPATAAGPAAILLAEDEEPLRRLLERILARAGYKVVAAGGGQEALGRFLDNQAQFDILLTDLVMPGMDGASLAEAVRTVRPGLPVVFMSGYDDPEHSGRVKPGELFLGKPLKAPDLLAIVAKALERRAA